MPAIAALTVADGQATPANHTFGIITADGKSGKFADKSSGIPAAYIRITDEAREPANASGAYRRLVSISLPTTAVVDGVTKVVRTSSAQLVWNFAQDSTDQERKDLVAYALNFSGNATVKASIWGLDPWY
jgi:hypothetical protein